MNMFFGYVKRNEHGQYIIQSDHKLTYATRFDNFADASRTLRTFASSPRKPNFDSEHWLRPDGTPAAAKPKPKARRAKKVAA